MKPKAALAGFLALALLVILGALLRSGGGAAPDARVVQALDRGLLMSQSVFHSGDSGGPNVDHLGRIVGVNSMSFKPTMPPTNTYKSYVRPVSELRPEHGLA